VLDVLMRWNRWGRATLVSGFKRHITEKIYPFLDTSDIVVLIGLRRAGKTTVLFQLMDYLETQQIPQEAMLHVNFEEPALGPLLGIELLDAIYQEFREKIFPTGKAYLFFDEIQNIPGWERWVRARNESEDIKIFLTGSSANLMSRELGTVLTGRHVSFVVNPLSFSEYLHFQNIEIPEKKFLTQASYEISHALEKYLQWGALPEVVLSQSDERRQLLLKQYLDDLLFKDVAMRHEIRDIHLLRNLAIYLLTQTASLSSFHRISKQFGISLEKASHYCSCLQESFLLDFLSFFSLKTAERNRHPFKIHAVDLGLRNIAALTGSEDKGRLIETAVYHQIKRKQPDQIYYWKGKQEIDFLLREGNTVSQLIQVTQQIENEKTLNRELNSFIEAEEFFPKAKQLLIIEKIQRHHDKTMMPLWLFLLS
jgi:predicted AAA+ superfamily ATPase